MYNRAVSVAVAIGIAGVIACAETTGPRESALPVMAGQYTGELGFNFRGPQVAERCFGGWSGKPEPCPYPDRGSLKCPATVGLYPTGDSTFIGRLWIADCQGSGGFELRGPPVTVTGDGVISEGHALDTSLKANNAYDSVFAYEELFDFPYYRISFLVGGGQSEDLVDLLGCMPLDDVPRRDMYGSLGDAARVYVWQAPKIWDKTPGATYVLEASGGYSPASRQLLCQGDTVYVGDIWLVAHRPANQ